MRLSHEAVLWLLSNVKSTAGSTVICSLLTGAELENLSLSTEEFDWLMARCPYLTRDYLIYLRAFRFNPSEHVQLDYKQDSKGYGEIHINVKGLWRETILYEIPLLALVSEAYFKFCDRDWNHDGQEEQAYEKGLKLIQGGCVFSEFGTRRRRDSKTQHMVIQGLKRAAQDSAEYAGKLTGTSNVYFAMQYGLDPVGTMAHEWFMGIAASEDDYEDATRTGLKKWTQCFGKGVLAVALTDTFGTPAFLKVFQEPIPMELTDTEPSSADGRKLPTYAEIFTGVRQDSGDPLNYISLMRDFYDDMGLPNGRTIVFSDSLNVEKCLEYKEYAQRAGFQPTFGIGTFLTSRSSPNCLNDLTDIQRRLLELKLWHQICSSEYCHQTFVCRRSSSCKTQRRSG